MNVKDDMVRADGNRHAELEQLSLKFCRVKVGAGNGSEGSIV